jgi:Zn-dependent M16 (insulinase) family peptidase
MGIISKQKDKTKPEYEMDSMNLKDFKTEDLPDHSDQGHGDIPLSGSNFPEEINALKIDKLSNKVTIISIIIPVMIGAILVFAYLDMKEQVVGVNQTKQSQVEQISRQLEEKLNALDVKIAKNRFDLDSVLPELKKKTTALDGRITKINRQVTGNAEQTEGINSSIGQIKRNAFRHPVHSKRI